MQILLISDIHANFPALLAVEKYFRSRTFDYIINCGDSVVYAPFPNETLAWLKARKAISILGNTDKKVIKLLRGKTMGKPHSLEKRTMYLWTAKNLEKEAGNYLQSFPKKRSLTISVSDNLPSRKWRIGIFHGSPARNHEFLFDTTPDARFLELSTMTPAEIIVCGHSHTPFYKVIGGTHFINTGSTGRMFDGDPRASCAVLQVAETTISVEHFRIAYDIEVTVAALQKHDLPKIYADMYRRGRKTN